MVLGAVLVAVLGAVLVAVLGAVLDSPGRSWAVLGAVRGPVNRGDLKISSDPLLVHAYS